MPHWMKNKLFNGQRPNKETMLILFLSGILIFIILLPVDKSGSKNNSSYNNQNEVLAPQTSSAKSLRITEEMGLQEYKETLECELEDFLSGMSGIGEVKALIYMKTSWEYQVEKDGDSRTQAQNEETVYTTNEYGQEVPFVKRYVCPQINGVALRVSGAVNEEARVRLVHLVMALYGLEANKVEVIN